MSCIIDAQEERDVAVIDIPNAFVQTRVEDEKDMVIIKLCGVLVDILVEIAPDVYKPYVTVDKKGVKQLLVQCQNALYGMMDKKILTAFDKTEPKGGGTKMSAEEEEAMTSGSA